MDSLWKRLRPYYYLGSLALERDKSGAIRSMALWKFLLRLIVSVIVISVVCHSGYAIIVYLNPHVTFMDIQKELSRFHKSTIDNIVINVLLVLATGSSMILIKENYTLSRKSPDYWKWLLSYGCDKGCVAQEISSLSQKWISR